MVAALGGDARAAAAPKPALNVAKLTKAEEAIFTLQPGKDAFVKLAQALTPFRPVVDHVADALQRPPLSAAESEPSRDAANFRGLVLGCFEANDR